MSSRIASSPASLEHQADVAVIERYENDQPVWYKQAWCSCGFRGEVTYITGIACGEMEQHLVEASVRPASIEAQADRTAQGGGKHSAESGAGMTAREKLHTRCRAFTATPVGVGHECD